MFFVKKIKKITCGFKKCLYLCTRKLNDKVLFQIGPVVQLG